MIWAVLLYWTRNDLIRALLPLSPRTTSQHPLEFRGKACKWVLENCIFWSEIGCGFGEPGGTPVQKFQGVPPSPSPSPSPSLSPSHLAKKQLKVIIPPTVM